MVRRVSDGAPPEPHQHSALGFFVGRIGVRVYRVMDSGLSEGIGRDALRRVPAGFPTTFWLALYPHRSMCRREQGDGVSVLSLNARGSGGDGLSCARTPTRAESSPSCLILCKQAIPANDRRDRRQELRNRSGLATKSAKADLCPAYSLCSLRQTWKGKHGKAMPMRWHHKNAPAYTRAGSMDMQRLRAI